MARFWDYPHAQIDIKDESKRYPIPVEKLALHRPFYPLLTEKGEINKIYYGSFDELKGTIGEGTFDEFSKWFKHSSIFARESAKKCKIFVAKVMDADATTATLALYAHVWQEDIPQYERDSKGYYVLDANGDKIPLLDGENNPITEPGYVLKWVFKQLESDQNVDTLVQETEVSGSKTITKYPILAMKIKGPGSYGNNVGLTFYWDSTLDKNIINTIDSLLYTMELVHIPYRVSNAIPIRDMFDRASNDFSFKSDAFYEELNMRYDLDSIFKNKYRDMEGNSIVPFNFHVYNDNVETIGNLVLTVETNYNLDGVPEIENRPYMVNIFNALSLEKVPYYHFRIETEESDAAVLDDDVINYFTGGSDGDTSDAKYEELVREFLTGEVNPVIKDDFRVPITTLFDSGYELETKYSLIDFAGIRENVQIFLSTQSAYEEPNEEDEDYSVGTALYGRALLHPESFLFGTEACRFTIMMGCGDPNFSVTWKKKIPLTMHMCRRLGEFHNSFYVKNEFNVDPHNTVDFIVPKSANWAAIGKDMKQRMYDSGLNYVQYGDMVDVFFPSIISVYPNHTSLISDSLFMTYMIYLKYIGLKIWRKWVGSTLSITELFGRIKDDVNRETSKVFGNFLKTECNVYQTEEDKLLGYALTIQIPVYDSVAKRVFNIIIPVRREE